jgi:hypothetical protein
MTVTVELAGVTGTFILVRPGKARGAAAGSRDLAARSRLTLAEVTFYGHDQAGREVSDRHHWCHLADWADRLTR